MKRFEEKIIKFNLINKMKAAKATGKIKHFGFSSHDEPENIKTYIDTGAFEVLLVQYNFLDPTNKEIIDYAVEKGLGVAIMGPVGGGRLAMDPTEDMKQWLTKGRKDFADLALKFVWSNPSISIALSGMSSTQMVEENLLLSSSKNYQLDAEESERVKKIATKFQEIYDLSCTQCGYCMPCPQEVNIKVILKQLMVSKNPLNLHIARTKYRGIGKGKTTPGNNATACTACGECLEKCPQNIPIIERIKEAHGILAE